MKTKSPVNLASLLLLLIFLSGCAGGRSFDYSVISIKPYLDGDSKRITLGVHDQRKYVKSGEKSPQYVGTQRSPAYVPWNINTKSGKSMAGDFQDSITAALVNDDYKVDSISIPPETNKEQAIKELVSAGNDRSLLITVKEWYFDIWYKVRMSCSLSLEVFDGEGGLLASAESAKEMWEDTDNAIPGEEFKKAMEYMLRKREVAESLGLDISYPKRKSNKKPVEKEIVSRAQVIEETSPPQITSPKPVNKSSCTTDQILKMKEMGMADKQIKAACK